MVTFQLHCYVPLNSPIKFTISKNADDSLNNKIISEEIMSFKTGKYDMEVTTNLEYGNKYTLKIEYMGIIKYFDWDLPNFRGIR